jgi:hypothetical protein
VDLVKFKTKQGRPSVGLKTDKELKIEKIRLLDGALSYLKHRGSARRETLERSLNVLNSGRCKIRFVELNHKLTYIPVGNSP